MEDLARWRCAELHNSSLHSLHCRFVLRCSRGVMRVAGRALTNQVAGLREEQEEQGGEGREAAS